MKNKTEEWRSDSAPTTNPLKKSLRICNVIIVKPFLDPTEMKGIGTIALTIHIHFVKLAKLNATVDDWLENAQIQPFIKF